MPFLVTDDAATVCSFGAAPSTLRVLPGRQGGPRVASILDHCATVNVVPFGLCTSPANPAVAAATASALGTLTPMPCIPATPAPWGPGDPVMLVDGAPACDSDCRLMCLWGGSISIAVRGIDPVAAPRNPR